MPILQAIRTHYLPPTNFKGSRVVAKCHAGNITVGWDHALNADENHLAACEALKQRIHARNMTKYGTPKAGRAWTNPTHAGCLPDGSYAHIFLP